MPDADWFPRPHKPTDIITQHPDNGFSPLQLFGLLSDPTAEEWTHKVDPSTSPTRLLASRGWVFKTNSAQRNPDLRTVQARVTRSNEVMKTLGIWHPAKTWFILRAEGHYWLCNLTPQLKTLQDLRNAMTPRRQASKRSGPRRQYLKLWAKALHLSARTGLVHGLILSLEAENFGCEEEERKDTLYYLDDEVYYFDLVYLFCGRSIWGLRLLED